MRTPHIHIPKDIQMLTILAGVLIIARVVLFGSHYFDYLAWNIFLGMLPFMASSVLLAHQKKGNLTKTVFVIGALIWLLVLPNAPYIVTDLIHIGKGHGAPVLYDTFLLFASAWLGMVLFLHSLRHIEEILMAQYGPRITMIKIPSIIFLTSVGIYIGRYLRFNSWDIVADTSFFADTWKTFTHPTHVVEAILFIVPCFFFIYMSYRAWKGMGK